MGEMALVLYLCSHCSCDCHHHHNNTGRSVWWRWGRDPIKSNKSIINLGKTWRGQPIFSKPGTMDTEVWYKGSGCKHGAYILIVQWERYFSSARWLIDLWTSISQHTQTSRLFFHCMCTDDREYSDKYCQEPPYCVLCSSCSAHTALCTLLEATFGNWWIDTCLNEAPPPLCNVPFQHAFMYSSVLGLIYSNWSEAIVTF